MQNATHRYEDPLSGPVTERGEPRAVVAAHGRPGAGPLRQDPGSGQIVATFAGLPLVTVGFAAMLGVAHG